MPQAPDHLMKETLYMKIIHLLDRHRTWLEIESIATVRNHTIVRNGRMTDILSRVLVVKAIHHHFPYTRGQVWQIAEYDLEQAIKSLRTTDGAFRQRIIKGELTLEDVERILMSAFFFVTMILHRSRRQFMTRFYLRMTALVTARKLYRLMLLILLYVFHFLYLCVHYNDIGVVASTIAFAIFFVFMDVERWLQRLHEERTPFCIAALAAVVFVFTPHLFTLAVTISFVLLASLFYPSRIVISLWKNKADRKMLLEDTEMLIIYYY